MERDSLRAAVLVVSDETELANDHAYVSGDHAEQMRRLRSMATADIVDMMVDRCRERAATLRFTASEFSRALRLFRSCPGIVRARLCDGMETNPSHAASEFQIARRAHRRVCKQLRDWLAQQAQHQRADAPLDLPPAANCDAPNSSTASTAA